MPRSASKKRTVRKYNKKPQKQEQEKVTNVNAIVAIMIGLSILLGVLIYTKQGIIGSNLSPALGGLFGFIKYIIPVGLFLMALLTAYNGAKNYHSGKIAMFIILLLCIDSIFSCYQISNGNININSGMDVSLSRAYDLGCKDIGGGVFGTFFAVILSKAIGTTGAVISFIVIAFVLCVLIFELKPADAISNSIDKVEERNARRKRERLENDQVIENIGKNEQSDRNINLNGRDARLGKTTKKDMEPLDDQITINLQDNSGNNSNNEGKNGIDVPIFKNGKFRKLHKAKDYRAVDDVQGLDKSKNNLQENNLNGNNISSGNNANSGNGAFGGNNANSGNSVNNGENNSLFEQKQVEKEAKTEQVLNLGHIMTEAELNYEFPPIEILQLANNKDDGTSRKALLATAEKLRKTLYSFGVSAKVENVSVGPAITRYEISPAPGVRVSKIANLADDIALSLEAETIRIEAPIPGKHAVGIEVPNKTKSIVSLREIIESDKFQDSKSKLAFALGKDVAGDTIVTDIAKMPHLLIAGSTGSGKSVCINTLIASVIYKAKPSEVKMLMIDPKIVELSIYNGIPHLLIPVVTDAQKAAGALKWAVQEMENRYNLFAQKNVRNIDGYNELADKEGMPRLPHMLIIIDELADLMMVASKEVQDAICRLAQKARAAGMHLVIATQRPSVDVITGVIKANIPSRIAFAVSSQVDSRTILDSAGAEKLLGKGDMLFYPAGAPKPTRIQGAFISDKEVENLVNFIKKDGGEIYDAGIMEKIEKANEPEKVTDVESEDNEEDPLLEEAIDLVVDSQTASTSFIQRRFKVGYARAGRIIDQMEERGIISGYQGSKPREVLMPKERWQELKMAPSDTRQNNSNAGTNTGMNTSANNGENNTNY
jgi:S-DNA-T family DNA segregation ATPase FtsK/SpoIIIE